MRPLGPAQAVGGLLAAPIFWTPFLLAYSSAPAPDSWPGWPAALRAACLELTSSGINPIGVVLAVGAWLAGGLCCPAAG